MQQQTNVNELEAQSNFDGIPVGQLALKMQSQISQGTGVAKDRYDSVGEIQDLKQQQKFCVSCGTQFASDAAFCAGCGAKQ